MMMFIDDSDTKVSYHVGMEFIPEANALVLIDEADIYMLEDKEKFKKFTSANICIGLTATPAITKMEITVAE
jgi:hypothetical protein